MGSRTLESPDPKAVYLSRTWALAARVDSSLTDFSGLHVRCTGVRKTCGYVTISLRTLAGTDVAKRTATVDPSQGVMTSHKRPSRVPVTKVAHFCCGRSFGWLFY